jgi:hypothetical protein
VRRQVLQRLYLSLAAGAVMRLSSGRPANRIGPPVCSIWHTERLVRDMPVSADTVVIHPPTRVRGD